MTGAQVAEKEVPGSKADMLHRGRNVALAFTMQVCVFLLSLLCPDLPFALKGRPAGQTYLQDICIMQSLVSQKTGETTVITIHSLPVFAYTQDH